MYLARIVRVLAVRLPPTFKVCDIQGAKTGAEADNKPLPVSQPQRGHHNHATEVPQMAAVPIAEAARRIGHRSRSQLYRLIDAGSLRDYLRRSPDGGRLLELRPPGLPSLAERVAACTSERINSAPRPKPKPAPAADEPRSVDVVEELWAPITPRINRELVDQGLPPLSPEHVMAVVRAAEDAIRDDFPLWDPETPEWWAAALEDADPDDPCPDPWRCEHCGEPWHVNHPSYRHSPARAAYVAELRSRHAVPSVESVNAAA